MPKISVVIPLYNKEKHIKETLESVLKQTFADFEVIIVNDGSTDNSMKIVRTMRDHRIKLFDLENQGASHARNYGIEKSKASLIAFLDADDYWYAHHLDDLINLYHEFPDCGLYAKAYEKRFYNQSVFRARYSNLGVNYFGVLNDYFNNCYIDNIAWTSSLAIPKKKFETYGNFDTSLRSGQDTDLWIRIALKEKVAFDSKISAQKRIYEDSNHLSLSSNVSDRIKILDRFKDDEKNQKNFKLYMDLNRFSMALERKLAKDYSNYKKIKNDIQPSNLNFKQKFLLHSPGIVLQLFKKIQYSLIRKKIYLTAFK